MGTRTSTWHSRPTTKKLQRKSSKSRTYKETDNKHKNRIRAAQKRTRRAKTSKRKRKVERERDGWLCPASLTEKDSHLSGRRVGRLVWRRLKCRFSNSLC